MQHSTPVHAAGEQSEIPYSPIGSIIDLTGNSLTKKFMLLVNAHTLV